MMLKKIITLLLLVNCSFVMAKKVKFSVDMTGQSISPNGVHISGDFQTEAGFPSDWDSKATVMTKEGNSNIYSVEVSIPAFRKYEYKFVNGDLFYEVEFVPEKSRVGYDFNDNRWIYVDSSSSEVSILPSLLFGGNAPAGKYMIRHKLDLTLENVANGVKVYVASKINNWQPQLSTMVSFDTKVYECIEFTDSISNEYIYYIGSNAEQVSGSCTNANKKRFLSVSSDTVLAEVCFAECTDCAASSEFLKAINSKFTLSPNPAQSKTRLSFEQGIGTYSVTIFSSLGQVVLNEINLSQTNFEINTSDLKEGIYFVQVKNNSTIQSTLKLIID